MSSSPRQQPDQKQKAKQSQGTQAEASRDAAVDSQASTRARSHAGASADRQTQVQQILSGFQGQIKPVRPSARYLVGIGIVAFVMLLLALLYLTAVISLGAALLVGL
ncbi:MAG: hypothetical protein EHM42_10215, partial [Planctomycetaceae bacterium]